jgi:zona occludens toxin (predicted ATPase)
MRDKFDRYREALVVETATIWPAEYQNLDRAEKQQIETALHADPRACEHLEYIRLHTGFCRQLTVTADDLRRLRGD